MEIHWQGMQEIPDEQIRTVESRVRSLSDGRRDLIDLRIVGKSSQHHRRGNKEVHIACQARGKRRLVATRNDTELTVALDAAVQALERQVHDLRDRRLKRRTRPDQA